MPTDPNSPMPISEEALSTLLTRIVSEAVSTSFKEIDARLQDISAEIGFIGSYVGDLEDRMRWSSHASEGRPNVTAFRDNAATPTTGFSSRVSTGRPRSLLE